MQGYNALWIPGTDHASISTEVKVINKLKEEGIDKNDLGREGFLKRTWEWREEYGRTIVDQLKKIGSSCDWDRERFTMDEGCSEAVLEVFTRLYEKGYIYKGSRIINCSTMVRPYSSRHSQVLFRNPSRPSSFLSMPSSFSLLITFTSVEILAWSVPGTHSAA